MPIERIATPDSGHLKLTGSLGEVRLEDIRASRVRLKCGAFQVVKESAELALSWVKTRSYGLGITNKRAQDPLRIPDAMTNVRFAPSADAQKKYGPSASVAMVRVLPSDSDS